MDITDTEPLKYKFIILDQDGVSFASNSNSNGT